MNTSLNTSLTAFLIAALAAATLSGCQIFHIYTADAPQGTPITQAQAVHIKQGMTRAQVQQVLGSPAVRDTLHPNRFDYIYHYKAGTASKKHGKTDQLTHFLVYFDDNGLVAHTAGFDSLPQKIEQPEIDAPKKRKLAFSNWFNK